MPQEQREPGRKLNHSTRPDLDQLSAQDIRFCQHYAETGNATEAYKQAKYHNSKGPDSAVWFASSTKLRNPKIRLYIRYLRQQAADVAEVTVSSLAVGFAAMAYTPRTAIFDDAGKMKPFGEWPLVLQQIVTGFDPVTDENGNVSYKVKFERGMEARKILAQWRGMIGADAEKPNAGDKKLVVGGEADPDKL